MALVTPKSFIAGESLSDETIHYFSTVTLLMLMKIFSLFTFRISICALSGGLYRVCNRGRAGPGRRSGKWGRVRGGDRCLPFGGPRDGRVARKGPDPKTRDLDT